MSGSFEAGMLNPVAAFDQTLHDLHAIVQLYSEDDSPVSDADFLQATHTASERLKAICMFSMAGLVTPVAGKVDPEAKRDFDYKIESAESLMTDEERQRKMLKLLRSITTQPPHQH